MTCPGCGEEALTFVQFLHYNPFYVCRCRYCDIALRPSVLTRGLCIVTLIVALASFMITFPAMSEFIESQPNKLVRTLLEWFLAYLGIPTQVVLFFIPTVAYTWTCGRLRVVTPASRGLANPRVRRPGDWRVSLKMVLRIT